MPIVSDAERHLALARRVVAAVADRDAGLPEYIAGLSDNERAGLVRQLSAAADGAAAGVRRRCCCARCCRMRRRGCRSRARRSS